MGWVPEKDAPEENDEQRDEGQAQDVAADARNTPPGPGPADSRHGGHADPGRILPDDVPDLIDRMKEMVRSGRIDNDAYAGEPVHDDEEEILGPHNADDDPIEQIADSGHDPLSDAGNEGEYDEDEDEDDSRL